MKKLLFILLFLPLYGIGQVTIAPITTPIPGMEMVRGSYSLKITDSLLNITTIGLRFPDSTIFIIGDTAKAIKQLYIEMKKAMEELELTKAILYNVSSRGFVYNRNRVAFNKSVKEYLKFKEFKNLDYYPMQNMDILIRDLKGKATGWIKQ